MASDLKPPEIGPDPNGESHQPQAISLREAAQIARRVQELVKAGREHSAWELMRHLHPADMGSIVAGLPRASRDTMLHIMSPETLVWMLRQTNPLVAGRVGTRLGVKMLTFALSQVHPNQALATLRRIPILRRPEVVEALEQPLPAEEVPVHKPGTAGSLMVTELATVDAESLAEGARERLAELTEVRQRLTHIYVVADGDKLVGQISMVDLALADNATPVREIARLPLATVENRHACGGVRTTPSALQRDAATGG